MIMDQHDKTGVGEHPGEAIQAVLADPGKAVRHRDRRARPLRIGDKQPPAQRHIALDAELDVSLLQHDSSSQCLRIC
jgi:hypothetical protein